jgi:hypothetical protein
VVASLAVAACSTDLAAMIVRSERELVALNAKIKELGD